VHCIGYNSPPTKGSKDRLDLNGKLPGIIDAIVKSITAEPRTQHLNRVFLPSRDAIIKSVDLLQQIVFPG
jgi:hypothetical protein